MSSRNLNRTVVVAMLAAVAGATAVYSLAATEPTAKSTPRNDADYLCKLDGKANSIGAVVKDDGRLYRCTSVLEERGVAKAAWVRVEMTTSIVLD
jgi:hypothetical protein